MLRVSFLNSIVSLQDSGHSTRLIGQRILFYFAFKVMISCFFCETLKPKKDPHNIHCFEICLETLCGCYCRSFFLRRYGSNSFRCFCPSTVFLLSFSSFPVLSLFYCQHFPDVCSILFSETAVSPPGAAPLLFFRIHTSPSAFPGHSPCG